MAEEIKIWQRDQDGPYIDMVLGQKKEIGVNLTGYWPDGLTLDTPVWSGPAGVGFSAGGVSGLIAKRAVQAIEVGEHACLVTFTSAGGAWVEPIAFRVIVK